METSNLHPCGICGTMAVDLDSLMSHLTEKHPNILHYKCHICNKQFKNYCVLIRLQTHFVTFHSGKPPPSLTEQVEQATTIQGYVSMYNTCNFENFKDPYLLESLVKYKYFSVYAQTQFLPKFPY